MTKIPQRGGLPRPVPVNPFEDRADAGIALRANMAFDASRYIVPSGEVKALPGVPLDEILDPARVEEYCRQEPWILTPLRNAPYSAQFGFVPERFRYMGERHEQAGRMAEAALCHAACERGLKIYYEQLKQDFRKLTTQMNRSEIGVYAQNLWSNVTVSVEARGSGIVRFVGKERHDMMDSGMKEHARDAVFKNTKWLALAINEIPLRTSMPLPSRVVN